MYTNCWNFIQKNVFIFFCILIWISISFTYIIYMWNRSTVHNNRYHVLVPGRLSSRNQWQRIWPHRNSFIPLQLCVLCRIFFFILFHQTWTLTFRFGYGKKTLSSTTIVIFFRIKFCACVAEKRNSRALYSLLLSLLLLSFNF